MGRAAAAAPGDEAGWPPIALWFTPEAVVLMVRDASGAWSERAEAPLDGNGQARGVAALHEAGRLADPLAEARPRVQLWLPEEHVVRLWLELEPGLGAGERLEAAVAAAVAQTGQPPEDLALSIGHASENGRSRLVVAAFAQTVREAQAYADGWGFRTGVVTAAPGLDGSDAPAGPPRSLTEVSTLRARAEATPRVEPRLRAEAANPPREPARARPRVGAITAAAVAIAMLAFFLGTEVGPLIGDRADSLDKATELATAERAPAEVEAPTRLSEQAESEDPLPALPEPRLPGRPAVLATVGAQDVALAPPPALRRGDFARSSPGALALEERRLVPAPPSTGVALLALPEAAPALVSEAPAEAVKPAAPIAPVAEETAVAPTVEVAADAAEVMPDAEVGLAPEAPSGAASLEQAALSGPAAAPAAPQPDVVAPILPADLAEGSSTAETVLASLNPQVVERPLPLDPLSGARLLQSALEGIAPSLPVIPPLAPLAEDEGRGLDLTPTAAAPQTLDLLPRPRPSAASEEEGEEAETLAAVAPVAGEAVPLPPTQPAKDDEEEAEAGVPADAAWAEGSTTEDAAAEPTIDEAPPSVLAAAAAPTPARRPKTVPPTARGSLVRLGAGSAARTADGPRATRPQQRRVQTVPIGLSASLPARVQRGAKEGHLSLGEMTLIGVFELEDGRQALLRLPNGRYQRLGIGDQTEGWQVTAIGGESVRLSRQGDEKVLALVAR